MDIFSHGLWSGALAQGLNNRGGKQPRLNVLWATFWGVLPDMFAFTIPFVVIVWGVAFGGQQFDHFGGMQPIAEPSSADSLWYFQLSNALYNISHSLIVFAIVFFGVWAYFKQMRLELLGWLLHIVMDIPTHTYEFFPTPIFWPIFDWKFNGFSWGQTWFMTLDIVLLLFVYGTLTLRRRRGIIDKKA